MDLLYDIEKNDMVLLNSGDFETTSNPSVQNGGILLENRAFNLSFPAYGVGFSSEIYGSETTEVTTELNRWQGQVVSDGGDAAWQTTPAGAGGNPFTWDVNYPN